MFATHFSNTATLQFDINSETTGLAEAYSNFPDLPAPAGFGTADSVRIKAQGGPDLTAGADGGISINLTTNFQYDPNAPVDFAGGQIDLFSVIDHELTHALGFLSFGPGAIPTVHSKFDQFLTDLNGTPLFDPTTFLVNQTAYNNASGNLALFAGSNAGSVTIQGQDPGTGADGALSHLGTAQFSAPPGGSPEQNALMLCCGGLNIQGEPRDYNAAEIGILADIGYTRNAVGAVPEPSTWAMLIGGFGFVGGTIRYRKRGTKIAFA